MNQSRKILILTNRIPYPLKDGGALAIHAMIKGWYDAGWLVYVLAMNTMRHYVHPSSFPPFYNKLAGFDTVDVDNAIRFLPTLKNLLLSRKPQHADRFYSDEYRDRLQKTLALVKPDVVQMESIYLSEYLPGIRANSKALVVQRLHNVEYQIWERLSRRSGNVLKAAYLKNLSQRIRHYEKQLWSEYDLLLPITEADDLVIRQSGCRTPTLVTPFGIDLDCLPFPETEHWNGYHIGAMDWLPNKEGLEWFISDIWPEVSRQNPNFEFYFAGRHMPESLTRIADDRLHCVGEVPDANDFIADKKILIVPLRSGSGIRVKTLEAMAAGKLVISTAVGIQGIEAKDKVHFLEANTAEAFAQAIKWSLQHKDEAMQIAANARMLIRGHYNQQLIMKNVKEKVVGMLQ